MTYTWQDFVAQFALTLVSLVAAVLTSLVVALLVVLLHYTMCWYSHWLMVIPLYVLPAISMGLFFHKLRSLNYAKSNPVSFKSNINFELVMQSRGAFQVQSVMSLEIVQFDATLLMLAVILLVITVAGVQSTYYVLVHLLFPLLRSPLIVAYEKLTGRKGASTTLVP